MKYLLSFAMMCLMLVSCQEPAPKEAPIERTKIVVEGYELEDVPGTNQQIGVKKTDQGDVVEQGFFEDGKRTGTWVMYENGKYDFPRKIITFTNNVYSGPYFEFDNHQGYISLKANYKNNKLHGDYAKFKIRRPLMEGHYVDGKKHGKFIDYDLRTGKLKKVETYQNDALHGPVIFYNDKEEVTAEYMYENGKKVSGGMNDRGDKNK